MLAAMLLLGLVPLAFLPVLEEEENDDDASETGPVEPGSAEGTGDLLVDEPPPDRGAEARLFEPETGPGEYAYEDFRPGEDRLRIDLGSLEGEVSFTTEFSDRGASISIDTAEGAMVLTFPGQESLPADDIEIILHDEGGGAPETIPLAELLAFEGSDDAATGGDRLDDALDPLDPEDPGNPGGGGGEPGLDPLDPEDPGEPGGGGDKPGLDPLNLDPGPSWGVGGDPAVSEALEAALTRDSAAAAGLDAALTRANHPASTVTHLGDGDDTHALPDDGIGGTGEGEVTLFSGTPAVASEGGVAVVDGAGGNDTLTGGDGAAWLFGGPGNDTITSGEGATAAFGGEGEDRISAASARAGAFIDGGAGDDTLTGSSGRDFIEGGSHAAAAAVSDNDVIDGGAGDDILRGGFGADVIRGGEGDDVIDHHGRIEEREEEVRRVFSDHIDGAADVLDGGPGNDTLIMDRGDTATGGQGEDYYWVWSDGNDAEAAPAVITDFEVGTDFLHISLNPELGSAQAWDLRVEPSPDGQDAHVIVAGDLVAVLKDAPDATDADVYVEVKPDVFAAAPQG
ncbi:Hemolysin-type calcium-binding repeat-containing protein [Meinhardsimonia xiamenensis]|jgi:Ca2+-binding RTX toxin-like protein|uniref:Hemolysin-type calcium-binding repeat-containing protein n=1 Tax=Meinhardsimonia xiamenensis TaxID=990712 RepID=A0A1G8ZA43_9RHOB|nr:calcium-binding protein [Meinhardsimonia xiamenensis]PRX37617.1 hemolysin type calcium-binding protein [Meinhardsimonia xiamenensis]SDK11921.1 Hemolysin-type calcium-binding repeat-containing protein [Meinhardsimonia xiamenensis]